MVYCTALWDLDSEMSLLKYFVERKGLMAVQLVARLSLLSAGQGYDMLLVLSYYFNDIKIGT